MSLSSMNNKSTDTFSAFLFDLDGTLLDTAPEFTFCMNQLLGKYNRPSVPEIFFKDSISKGARAMVQHCFALNENDPELGHKTKEFLTLYENTLGNHTLFFPGINKLLETLTLKNIPWGIVTNKVERYTHPLIAKFPLLHHAKSVISGDTLNEQKPHPAPVFLALEQLNASPETTLFVGDAQTDIIAGQTAGLKCMVAQYGYIHPEENPILWKADYYIDKADQLLSYFV